LQWHAPFQQPLASKGNSSNCFFEVECDVTNPPPGFVSGATVGVDVELSSAAGLVVPADAVLEGDKGAWVFAVDNGTVKPVQVEVLDRSLDTVAIKGNVRAGEPVIVARPSRLMTLAAGMKVAAVNAPQRQEAIQ
jgi:multidrug efflux pump subunit AcrA (membrane-fusion protein)